MTIVFVIIIVIVIGVFLNFTGEMSTRQGYKDARRKRLTFDQDRINQ